MAKRFKMSKSHSKKSFRNAAARVHVKNLLSSSGSQNAMRGGIRL